jgi:hypothetical protein
MAPADAGTREEEALAPADDWIEAREWLAAHGAKGDLEPFANAYGCASFVVGSAREPAVSCVEVEDVSAGGDENPVYRVVSHRIVRVVRNAKVVSVLDVMTRIEALDGPVALPGEESRGFLDLDVTIARDGMSAKVVPLDPKTDCHAPAASPDPAPVGDDDKEFLAQNRAWIDFDSKWEAKMCKQRGTYVWKSGRFVRR